MCDVMVISLPILSSYGLIRRVRVSLPRVDVLIADQPGKYALLENLPPLSKADAQPIGKQRLYHRPRAAPRMTAREWRELERSLGEPVA